MGQYNHLVERQRLLLKAEKWAKEVASIHAHSIDSMWYDNRPEDTSNNKTVVDITYNSGIIERILSDSSKVYFGEKLSGDDLLYHYRRVKG